MTHEHNWYAFQVKAEFEPYVIDTEILNIASSPLYQRIEYLYSSCRCGMGKKEPLNND